MGWFDWLTGEKHGTFIEGRGSREHTHKDGTTGKDIYAAKVTYDHGEKVSEKDAGFGHISEGSSNPDHVK